MMASPSPPKVLVLGATGPAGICLVRELVHRDYTTIVYARNPSKLPDELSTNPLVTVIKGEMEDHASLSKAVGLASVVISLLGPSITNRNISPTLYSNYYSKDIFPLIREAGVTRIMAMGTISISRPEDKGSLFQLVGRTMMRLLANNLFQNMLNLASVFDEEAQGLDWTVFRIAAIPGGSSKEDWEKDREKGPVFAGPIGAEGWTSSVHRAALARWLVDNMLSDTWFGQMPGVGRQAK